MQMAKEQEDIGFPILILLSLLCLSAFLVLGWDWARQGPSFLADQEMLRHTQAGVSAHPSISRFFAQAGVLGINYCLWTIVLLLCLALALKREWPALLVVVFLIVSGTLFLDSAKSLFQRPRPIPGLPGASGFSYPSGGVFLAFLVYGSAACLAARLTPVRGAVRAVQFGSVVAVLLVGLSRLSLQLHWLTDILGAYALGASWISLNLAVLKIFEKAIHMGYFRDHEQRS
jgi:membrane-associated phospholipid phosphatase